MSEEIIIAQLRERDFYIPKPKSFLVDVWLWTLVFFPLVSTVGLSVLAYFGFGFTALQSIGNQESLTRIAATCLALGEIGSFFAAIEVFRKAGRRETIWWDWVAVVTSGITTATAVAIGWAWTVEMSAWWKIDLQQNTPLLLSILAVLDTVLAGSEAGLYLSQGNQRLKVWQDKYEKWADRQEQLIKRYQEMIWKRQEVQWGLEIEEWKSGDTNIVPPSDHVTQTEDKALPTKKKKPKRKKVVKKTDRDHGFKVAPRGERDHYAREVEGSGWMAVCPECDWTRGGYDTKGKAIQAIIGHSKGCPGRISVEGKVGPGAWKDGRF